MINRCLTICHALLTCPLRHDVVRVTTPYRRRRGVKPQLNAIEFVLLCMYVRRATKKCVAWPLLTAGTDACSTTLCTRSKHAATGLRRKHPIQTTIIQWSRRRRRRRRRRLNNVYGNRYFTHVTSICARILHFATTKARVYRTIYCVHKQDQFSRVRARVRTHCHEHRS